MNRILVVDDERKIRETIRDYLTFRQMEVTLAADGAEALELCRTQSFDLILLDVMMPVMNGIDACREIRKFSQVPVLFLTALGEEEDMLAGFSAGADDYIVKPFPLSVLQRKCESMIARYRGAFREQDRIEAAGDTQERDSKSMDSNSVAKEGKPAADHTNTLTLAGITVNMDSMTVSENGRKLPVTGKDYELLLYLMQNPGRVLSREMILIRIWGYDFEGESRVVDTHIKRLRKSLGEKAGCIRTRVNVGYSFDAEA